MVKNVLNQNCSNDVPPPDLIINDSNKDNWCDWAPFGKYVFSRILSKFSFLCEMVREH